MILRMFKWIKDIIEFKNVFNKYRRFETIDEATFWGKKHFSYWLPRYQVGGKLRHNYEVDNLEMYLHDEWSVISKEEIKKDAIENKWFSFYCGGNYGLAINKKLRFGNTESLFSEDELIEMQEIMDNRLSKSFVPENIWGYRYLKYDDLCSSTKMRNIKRGMFIEDKGYMGVGLVKSQLQREFDTYDTLLKIMIPERVNGLYIDLISNRREEQEVLFARGSKLKVIFKYRSKGKRIIVCQML